ncbi:hypothetical protein [Capnocytophaga sputigena]
MSSQKGSLFFILTTLNLLHSPPTTLTTPIALTTPTIPTVPTTLITPTAPTAPSPSEFLPPPPSFSPKIPPCPHNSHPFSG